MNILGISQDHVDQLRAYLQDDPLDITMGIPEEMAERCGRIVELYFKVKARVPRPHHECMSEPFVSHIFETALLMIFNMKIPVTMLQLRAPGVMALFAACDEMEMKERDDVEGNLDEETRNNIPDWDAGMIACAIIKACGNAFLATIKDAETDDDTPQTP